MPLVYFICCRLTDLQQQTLVFIFKNTVLKGLVRLNAFTGE